MRKLCGSLINIIKGDLIELILMMKLGSLIGSMFRCILGYGGLG